MDLEAARWQREHLVRLAGGEPPPGPIGDDVRGGLLTLERVARLPLPEPDGLGVGVAFAVQRRSSDEPDDFLPVALVPAGADRTVRDRHGEVLARLSEVAGIAFEVVRYRPARAACVPGAPMAQPLGGASGTVGAVVTRTGDPEILSCHHVIAGPHDAALGSAVEANAGGSVWKGTVSAKLPFDAWAEDNPFDAALADFGAAPVGANPVMAVLDEPADTRDQVRKHGAVTGITEGEATQFDLGPFPIEYQIGSDTEWVNLSGLVVIRSDQPFGRPGDSGALVWEPATGRALGLLVATTSEPEPDGRWAAYVSPLAGTLEALGARLYP